MAHIITGSTHWAILRCFQRLGIDNTVFVSVRCETAILGADLDILAPRFQLVGKPRAWEWLVTAPDAANFGRMYEAVGAILRPMP